MKVFDACWLTSTLSLDRFEEDRDNVRPGSGDFFKSLGVIEGYTNKPRD